MANVGEKRSAPELEGGGTGSPEKGWEKVQPSPAKKSVPSGFIFRPSVLQQATQGFSLKHPTLPSSLSASPEADSKDNATSITPLQGGFLKLDSNELKSITVPTTLAPVPLPTSGFSGFRNSTGTRRMEREGGVRNQMNHAEEAEEEQGNLFLQFLARTSAANSFTAGSRDINNPTPLLTPNNNNITSNSSEDNNQSDIPNSEVGLPEPSSSDEASGGVDAAGMPIGFQGSSAILPDIQIVTGEEKERKIVQVPARLYVFDIITHTWKERGHGELRLNDSAQSEGVFQSRVVMRTLGSYRILLNTYLWAHMRCERANQKGIRITAQHGDQGKVGVFLITGASKDIQQLFTAIDRRIEALRRNSDSSIERDSIDAESQSVPQALFDDDDKESFLGEQHSSPDSSPDCRVGSRTRHAPTINMAGERESSVGGEKEAQTEVGVSREGKEEVSDSKQEAVSSSSNTKCESGGGSEGGGGSDKESTSTTPPSSRSPDLD